MKDFFLSFLSAILFYTTFKIPLFFSPNFNQIARWLTFIGLLIGSCLAVINLLFELIDFPTFTRSILIISVWIYFTGGLHLDGVIDTADGLAVTDDQKRLSVMRDSVTGAFGVMAAVILLFIKTLALGEITYYSWLSLILATTWGRFAQFVAIAKYPYLRETGKGDFLAKNLHFPQDFLLISFPLLLLIIAHFFFTNQSWYLILFIHFICLAIAIITGFWFHSQLGGHTGDTYGATVEWSEAFILCFLTLLWN